MDLSGELPHIVVHYELPATLNLRSIVRATHGSGIILHRSIGISAAFNSIRMHRSGAVTHDICRIGPLHSSKLLWQGHLLFARCPGFPSCDWLICFH
jgi:hypothetical protein